MNEPSFSTEKVEEESNYGQYYLSPLPAGFGHTLGIALRRTLLSAIEGYAVTYVKINDVVHAFTNIEGIKQTAMEIILNLKQLRFKTKGEGPYTMTLSANGKQVVKAADFKGGDIEIVNKDQMIAEITSASAKLEIEIEVDKGIGYSPAEEKDKKEFGKLAVDSVFTTVEKVNFSVEGARVGRKSDYDKLKLQIWTDGSSSAEQVLKKASALLSSYFSYILSGKDTQGREKGESDLESELSTEVDKKVYQTIIDELDLPTRVVNALLRENIETVEDLIKRGKEDLVGLKGVGRKSLDLIEKELEKLGIPFNEQE